MMICKVCGSELDDNSKFCVYCGSTLEQEIKDPAEPAGEGKPVQKAEQPAVDPELIIDEPAAPAPSGIAGLVGKVVQKLGRKGAAIAASAVAVAAVAGVTVATVSNMPSVKVPQAISRSVAAFTEVYDKIGLTGCLDFVQKDNAYDSSVALTFEGMNEMMTGVDMSDMEGLGIRAVTSFSLKDRRMSGTLAAIHDEDDLLAFQYGVDDEIMWFESEALADGRYGFNTTTLGEDLVDLGANGMDGLESLGFNLFDLYEMSMNMKPSEEVTKAFAEAFKTLNDAIEIEGNGSDEIKVNGERIKCSAYTLTIPEDALADFLDDIEDPMVDYYDDTLDATWELYSAIGVPDSYIDEMSLDSDLEISDAIDDLRDVLEEIGDVELEIYIDGGYVMAVIYELEIDGETMVLTMNMGGNDNYVDDFSLTIEYEDEVVLEMESTGNHTGKGGEYTDETEITMMDYGDSITISMDTTYLSKEKEDNFEWKLSMGNNSYTAFEVKAEGQLDVEKKGLHLNLEEIALESSGIEVLSLGLDYSISPYSGAEKAGKAEMLFEMSENDLEDLAEELSDNMTDVLEDFVKEFPMLEYMMYMMYTPYNNEFSAVYYG